MRKQLADLIGGAAMHQAIAEFCGTFEITYVNLEEPLQRVELARMLSGIPFIMKVKL